MLYWRFDFFVKKNTVLKRNFVLAKKKIAKEYFCKRLFVSTFYFVWRFDFPAL